MKMVLTGGGSSGHVSPLLAVAAELVASRTSSVSEVTFLGSTEGPERHLATTAGYPYFPIATGKLRRYIDWKHLGDPFHVPVGVAQARKLLQSLQPAIVLSSGGYVSVPTVIAAWTLRIPIVLFEPNARQGLANRMTARIARKICLGFPDPEKHFPRRKAVVTGHPVRPEMIAGISDTGFALTKFHKDRPVLLVIGGSQGASYLNTFIRRALPRLTPTMQVVHLCGPGNLAPDLLHEPQYVQFEYVTDELPHLYAMSTIALTRAGAATLAELAACRLPAVLVPLPTSANDHQAANAKIYAAHGASIMLNQTEIHADRLVDTLCHLVNNREKLQSMKSALEQLGNRNAAHQIIHELTSNARSASA